MNAYTTIEESKQLIEAGLDINTADMYTYKNVYTGALSCFNNRTFIGNYNSLENKAVAHPCWSLAALIELLPDYIEYWDKEGYCYNAFLEISKHSVTYRYFDQYQDMYIQLFEAFDEYLVSSVCKTIIWLLEHNYIKSNKNE